MGPDSHFMPCLLNNAITYRPKHSYKVQHIQRSCELHETGVHSKATRFHIKVFLLSHASLFSNLDMYLYEKGLVPPATPQTAQHLPHWCCHIQVVPQFLWIIDHTDPITHQESVILWKVYPVKYVLVTDSNLAWAELAGDYNCLTAKWLNYEQQSDSTKVFFPIKALQQVVSQIGTPSTKNCEISCGTVWLEEKRL